MAMTSKVKDELSRHEVTKTCCRKAEIASLLRFAGGLHIVSRKIVVEAELDTANAARRLRKDIAELYGYPSELMVLAAGGLRKGSRYVVTVGEHGPALARQTGLVDAEGRPVRGLPPRVVGGSVCDAESAWRGAFLARGSLTEPGRSSSLEVTCPGSEAALALVGAREHGVRVRFDVDPAADRVVADKVQVQQVLLNLIRNAVDVMEDAPVKELGIAVAVIDEADLGEEDAELTVGDAQDNYMAFYDPSELPVLVELL